MQLPRRVMMPSLIRTHAHLYSFAYLTGCKEVPSPYACRPICYLLCHLPTASAKPFKAHRRSTAMPLGLESSSASPCIYHIRRVWCLERFLRNARMLAYEHVETLVPHLVRLTRSALDPVMVVQRC
jgi:hypothetical protein